MTWSPTYKGVGNGISPEKQSDLRGSLSRMELDLTPPPPRTQRHYTRTNWIPETTLEWLEAHRHDHEQAITEMTAASEQLNAILLRHGAEDQERDRNHWQTQERMRELTAAGRHDELGRMIRGQRLATLELNREREIELATARRNLDSRQAGLTNLGKHIAGDLHRHRRQLVALADSHTAVAELVEDLQLDDTDKHLKHLV